MRTVQVSTEVFAAIWKAQQPGETSETTILARLLGVKVDSEAVLAPEPKRDIQVTVGFRDPRFGVELEPGFQIYRTYLGKEYRAQAIQGFWVLNTDQRGYPSLNELSRAIGAKTENAWSKWFFDHPEKGRTPLSAHREQGTIRKRNQPSISAADLGLE